MTVLTVNHVTKFFLPPGDGRGQSVRAVDDVSFKLNEGEVLAIIGPSGCGKSTLLRMIAGLMPFDQGEVLYDGVPIQEVPLQERGIGMVFQEGALIPHWEARKSVGFFLSLRKREHEVPERIQRIAKITGIGLDKLLDRHPRQLSGGEKQRVSVARALTRDMRLLLFDEPFANIDAKLRAESRTELKRLMQEFPVTSIYVTHDQTEAVALSNRIAVMREGRFEQLGTYQLLHDSPINMFIASFIGTPRMNFFQGEIRAGKWYGEEFGGYPIRGDLPDGTKVTLGIRPKHMFLKSGGVAGVVDVVIPYLAEKYQLVEVWLGKERWAITVPPQERITVGETIYCDLDPKEALYFDTRTDKRIG